MEKKKLYELLGAIFVAVIFLSSYAAFSNNGSSTTTTTTINGGSEFYSVGNVNGTLTGYGPVLNVNITCSSNTIANESAGLQNTLAGMEANNIVSNYYSPSKSLISIDSGSRNVSYIYSDLYTTLNGTQAKCTGFTAQGQLTLEALAQFKVGSQSIQVLLSNATRRQLIPITLSQNSSSKYTLRVAALLYENGTIAGNMTIISSKSV